MSPDDDGSVVLGLLFILMGFVIYFVPTGIAITKQKRNTAAIFTLNLFLGWTLVGWVAALVWALMVEPEKTG